MARESLAAQHRSRQNQLHTRFWRTTTLLVKTWRNGEESVRLSSISDMKITHIRYGKNSGSSTSGLRSATLTSLSGVSLNLLFVNKTEDARVRADAESKRENGNQHEARFLQQHSRAVAQVLPKGLHHSSLSNASHSRRRAIPEDSISLTYFVPQRLYKSA